MCVASLTEQRVLQRAYRRAGSSSEDNKFTARTSQERKSVDGVQSEHFLYQTEVINLAFRHLTNLHFSKCDGISVRQRNQAVQFREPKKR